MIDAIENAIRSLNKVRAVHRPWTAICSQAAVAATKIGLRPQLDVGTYLYKVTKTQC